MSGKYGIIAALPMEVRILKAALEEEKTVSKGISEFYTGKIGENEVILLQCGMGKVSAAAGAQAMISLFEPDCIINTGCAGGIGKGIGIGDVVLATATAEWDLDTIAIGNPRGFVSSMGQVKMEADGALRAVLRAAVPEDVKVREGLVVSGDAFVSTKEQREIILGAFPDALCAEMEGAAIGHVATENGVPFAVVRCMSDTADAESHVDFAEFARIAGEKSAAILLTMLK